MAARRCDFPLAGEPMTDTNRGGTLEQALRDREVAARAREHVGGEALRIDRFALRREARRLEAKELVSSEEGITEEVRVLGDEVQVLGSRFLPAVRAHHLLREPSAPGKPGRRGERDRRSGTAPLRDGLDHERQRGPETKTAPCGKRGPARDREVVDERPVRGVVVQHHDRPAVQGNRAMGVGDVDRLSNPARARLPSDLEWNAVDPDDLAHLTAAGNDPELESLRGRRDSWGRLNTRYLDEPPTVLAADLPPGVLGGGLENLAATTGRANVLRRSHSPSRPAAEPTRARESRSRRRPRLFIAWGLWTPLTSSERGCTVGGT
jgi:hypothetical protein